MMTATAMKLDTTGDYKIKDITLAEWGRKEIEMAEHEDPASSLLARPPSPFVPLRHRFTKGVALSVSVYC